MKTRSDEVNVNCTCSRDVTSSAKSVNQSKIVGAESGPSSEVVASSSSSKQECKVHGRKAKRFSNSRGVQSGEGSGRRSEGKSPVNNGEEEEAKPKKKNRSRRKRKSKQREQTDDAE